MESSLRLLSRAVNFAVVQLPGRASPGVVIQGDTLSNLVHQIDRALVHAKSVDGELLEDLEQIKENLLEALAHYEKVCSDNGIALPYRSRQSK